MTNYVYVATSLDGFIATSAGGLDWLDDIPNPDKSDFGYAEFMSGIDAIVMGRKTFDKILTFDDWPYDKPVYVLSKNMVEIPKELESKVKIINANPKTVVNQLKEFGHHNLYIDGGVTIQGFLGEDLVDKMIITRVPVLLGEGIPLFGKLTKRLHFKLEKTELLNATLSKSYYTRIRI